MRKSELSRKMRLQEQRDPDTHGPAAAVIIAAFLSWAIFGFKVFGWLVGDSFWGAVLHGISLVVVWHLLRRLHRNSVEDPGVAHRRG